MKTNLCDGKLVVDADLVKVFFTGAEHRVFIKMSKGDMIEHEPFPPNLEGLIASMQLATEVCAGKFFPRCVVETTSPTKQIPSTPLRISGPGQRRG